MKKRKKLSDLKILSPGTTTRYNTYTMRGEILGRYTSGFNLPSGAWSLYPIDPDGVPAEFLRIRAAHCRQCVCIPVDRVVSVDGKPLEVSA